MTATYPEIVDSLPDAAALIDKSGIVVAANTAAREAFQVQAVGLPFISIFRNAAVANAIHDVQVSGMPLHVEVEAYGKSPTVFGVHVAPLGKTGSLLITLRDLTQEQRIERMRSDFVANASHEMRTPLASIIGLIETLMGAARNDAKARENFLVTMLGQAHRMKRLIDDLLTLSRIELREHVRPSSKVSLVEIAKQAKGNLKAMADELKMIVNVTTAEPTWVIGDAEELLQVAQNLLENALKYGASGGTVELSCKTEDGKATLSVTDHGPGIAEIHIPRLTERFYRVNTQESRARGGTGLGLAIVKHITSRHRGRLDITSQVGVGSVFTVTIPLYKSIT